MINENKRIVRFMASHKLDSVALYISTNLQSCFESVFCHFSCFHWTSAYVLNSNKSCVVRFPRSRFGRDFLCWHTGPKRVVSYAHSPFPHSYTPTYQPLKRLFWTSISSSNPHFHISALSNILCVYFFGQNKQRSVASVSRSYAFHESGDLHPRRFKTCQPVAGRCS